RKILQRTRLLLSLIVICLVAPLRAQTSAPKPDPELKKLHVLIGHWTYEGEYKPGPLGGGSKVKGVWDARMILGGFFLHEEVNEKVDAGRVARARHRIIRPCKQRHHHGLGPAGWDQ